MSIDVKAIRDSFAIAKPIMPKVINHFYATLFKDYPEAKPLFKKVDMKKQKKQLAGSLAFAVKNLEDPEKLKKALSDMGKRHVAYGTLPEHYDWVGATLLKTFAHFFGDQWTEELENEWAKVYKFMASTMIKATKPKSAKNSDETLESYSSVAARELLMEALEKELNGEFKKIAAEKAREILKRAIAEEAKKLHRTTKKKAVKS